MTIAHTPPVEWQQKVWGRTRCAFRGPNFEVWELEVKKGGFCSRHTHRKWNLFHIQEGTMRVELFGDGDAPTENADWFGDHVAGDQCKVKPGDWHRFVALTDCKLIEVYWTTDIDPADIKRFDEGGVLQVEQSA